VAQHWRSETIRTGRVGSLKLGSHEGRRKENDLRRHKSTGVSGAANSHLENMLDEALSETFPASDPIAITIEPHPRAMRGSKVVPAPTTMRGSILRGPLIAEAEPEGAEEQTLTSPFNAMLWGPIQLFTWWSLLIGGRLTHSPSKTSAAK
jgi:hypothetical protein